MDISMELLIFRETTLRDRLDELDKNKYIAVYCKMGLKWNNTDRMLTQNGFKVLNLIGGYKTSDSQKI
jgi:rhodanese-related sulfurtransferase